MTVRRLVVGAAVVHDGRLLAARRTTPRETAGRWELPGGKVERGEAPEEALVREIREELDCGVEVVFWLEGDAPVGTSYRLRVAVCRLVDGEPAPGRDHDELRRLAPEELDEVDWLEPDRPFLARLRELVGTPTDGSSRPS